MAVDAGHLSLFPSQLIPNRGMMNAIEPRVAADYLYGAAAATPAPAMGYRVPVSGASATVDDTSSLLLYASMKAAAETSDLTYNHHLPPPPSAAVSRKRPRETQIPSVDPFVSSYASPMAPAKICSSVGSGLSFLGEDYSIQILQQQVEIDRFISQHMEKVRLDIEERRKRQSRRIIAAVETAVVKRLQAKEEEIDKIGKLNWALEERVRSLCVENQIWRDLAHTNEATANALRTNLEQALADAAVARHCNNSGGAAVPADDAESCCGSNDSPAGLDADEGTSERFRVADGRDAAENRNECGGGDGGRKWWCRSCGKEEACVLLLPCRHLCLCTGCGSTLHTCPICNAHKDISVHVNLSSS